MKDIHKILLAVSAFLMITGCEQEVRPDNEEANIPEYGYIFFDTEVGVSTRGELYQNDDPNDNRLYADFGVMGYTYVADEWTTAEVQAVPNVFSTHNLKVTWNGTKGISSQHSYDNDGAGNNNLVPWIGRQNYAFFAYSPFDGITTSGSTYEGNPYIDFTLPSRTDVSGHIDVMTAHAIGANYSTRSVGFHFYHRLTALEVVANNLYTTGENVAITDLTIELDNILYDKVKIPLNMRDEPAVDYSYGFAADKKAEFKLHSGVNIPVATNTDLTGPYKKTMIIIPQDQHVDLDPNDDDDTMTDCTVTGKAHVRYTVNGTTSNLAPDFKINRDLMFGRRYQIQLNFSAGDVNVVIIESDEWVDSDKIYHEFE